MSTATTTRLVDTLVHLIRMPTISGDHATNRAAMDWIQEQLRGLPLNFKRYEPNGTPILIATTTGVKQPKNPKLWLAAHLDVVPAEPELFEPVITNGRLVGRGAYDMKPAIALFITLLKELGAEAANYDLGLIITADEEIGGSNGVGWLVDHQGYRGQAVLLPDSLKNWEIEASAKGCYFWKLTSHGQAAHGSRIWDGTNAIDQLIRFVEHLRANTVTEPCHDPIHMHHTLNLGQISGGMAANQIAETAEAMIDFRVTPGTTIDDVKTWVAAAQLAVPGVEAQLQHMKVDAYTSKDGPVHQLFNGLAEAAIGHPMPKVIAHGGTDARWFSYQDIPVITVNSTGGNPHGSSEWIDLADLERYAHVVRQFVDAWAKR
jgi:succinyl-diaminopimelate desuccinylase